MPESLEKIDKLKLLAVILWNMSLFTPMFTTINQSNWLTITITFIGSLAGHVAVFLANPEKAVKEIIPEDK